MKWVNIHSRNPPPTLHKGMMDFRIIGQVGAVQYFLIEMVGGKGLMGSLNLKCGDS